MKLKVGLLAWAVIYASALLNAQKVAIIPEPYQMKVSEGQYSLPKLITINAPSDNVIAKQISDQIKLATGYSVSNSKTKPVIDIEIVKDENIGNEGYLLDVNAKGIQLKANTNQGLFYGW